MRDNSGSDVEIKYIPSCSKPIPNGCSNIHVGEIVNFTAVIKPLKCPADGKPKIIKIKPGAVDEDLTLVLEVLCDCECQRKNHSDYVENAAECTSEGSLECGVCKCNPGRFGRNCECDKETSVSNDVSACKASNESEICSGQ